MSVALVRRAASDSKLSKSTDTSRTGDLGASGDGLTAHAAGHHAGDRHAAETRQDA